ncbi:MAG: phosphoribosylanthranilate isomerase [Gammaproteobacteria bacterium]
MSFIKICGLTTEASVKKAIELKVDSIGFVFSPSPRQLDPIRAKELFELIPQGIQKVAVFKSAKEKLVEKVLRFAQPDCIQADFDSFEGMEFNSDIITLPVYRSTSSPIKTDYSLILFEGSMSGVGELANWQEAKHVAKSHKTILAGGLSPDNVIEAIRYVSPWGVDVSSGVESIKGEKDLTKMKQFVINARKAFESI